MTSKTILLSGIAIAALSGTAFTTALADDYDSGRPHYDNQAEQTRELNREALEQAREQNRTQSRQSDDDSDEGAVVVPADDRDPQDDEDDDDDDAPAGDKDGRSAN